MPVLAVVAAPWGATYLFRLWEEIYQDSRPPTRRGQSGNELWELSTNHKLKRELCGPGSAPLPSLTFETRLFWQVSRTETPRPCMVPNGRGYELTANNDKHCLSQASYPNAVESRQCATALLDL